MRKRPALSNPSVHSENCLNEGEQPVKEIVYVRGLFEPLLAGFGVAYLKVVSNPGKFPGLPFERFAEFGRR